MSLSSQLISARKKRKVQLDVYTGVSLMNILVARNTYLVLDRLNPLISLAL